MRENGRGLLLKVFNLLRYKPLDGSMNRRPTDPSGTLCILNYWRFYWTVWTAHWTVELLIKPFNSSLSRSTAQWDFWQKNGQKSLEPFRTALWTVERFMNRSTVHWAVQRFSEISDRETVRISWAVRTIHWTVGERCPLVLAVWSPILVMSFVPNWFCNNILTKHVKYHIWFCKIGKLLN